ncbi:threonine/serine exporter family protein [Clostridium senegalense]|uniref:threonine/serine exporter family protein n=1 Tax=Clostridium senegalense TaxID=1465809 RepID=UPI000288F82C|nr:threonine/serine exporter family protein [Clostridium senegalense]
MKKRRIYIGGLVLLTGIILILNYITSLGYYKSPPSKIWSKEVIVGEGVIKNPAPILKDEEKVIVGYDDKDKLKISITDSVGKIIDEKAYDIDEDFIMGTSLCKSKDGYWFSFTSTKNSVGYMETLILDENFNKKDSKKIEDIIEMKQLDDNLILICTSDKIEVINTKTEEIKELDEKGVSMISSVKLKDKYLITFLEKQTNLKAVIFENNQFNIVKDIKELPKMQNVVYSNMACSADDKYGYILLEEETKGVFSGSKLIKYGLNNNEVDISKLRVNNSEEVYYNKGFYSEKGARFLATTPRLFGKKDYQENIIDYIINDGKVKEFSYVTRLRELCIYPYINGDIASFVSFKNDKKFNINIASTNEDFKKINNESRKEEYSQALIATVQGIAYSFSYLFVLAIKWLIPVFVIGGIVSFFDYSFTKEKRAKSFIVLACFAIIAKCYAIITTVYGSYKMLLPQFISNTIVGTIVCLIIGALSYGLGYNFYKKDTEILTLIPLSISLIIDSIITLLIFVPYMT